MTSPAQHEPPDNEQSRDIDTAFETPQPVVVAAEVVASEAVRPAANCPHPHIGWALLWMLAYWAVQIAVTIVVVVVAMIAAVAQGINAEEQMERAMANVSVIMIPVGTLFSVITAIVIALIFYRRQFAARLALRGMSLQQWLASLMIVLPLTVISSEITNYAGEVLPTFSAEVLGEFAASPWLLVFVTACLFPAIGEEIFCRGFIGRGLVAHHGAVGGVLLASLLFGIMHVDPVQSVGAFVLGLGLHFIYLTTRSLLAPMLVHMLNNFFAFWLMRNYHTFPLPGLSPLPDETQVHTPPGVMIAAIVAAAALFGLLYQTRTRWLLPAGDSQDGEEMVWSPGYVTAERPPSDPGCRAKISHPKLWLAALVVLSYIALCAALAIESQAVLAS